MYSAGVRRTERQLLGGTELLEEVVRLGPRSQTDEAARSALALDPDLTRYDMRFIAI